MSADLESRKASTLWGTGFLLIILVHAVWHFFNRMPPAWDMAFHQRLGWSYYQALIDGNLLAQLSRLSDYYPPLYYLIEAALYALLGPSRWMGFLANLPGLFLLSFFTFALAREATGSKWSAVAGHLAPMFPLVAWTSRETLLDPTLAGLVALSLYLLFRSDRLEKRGWALLWGLTLAAGLLLKWTFLVFALPGILWSLSTTRHFPVAARNLLDATLIAMPPVLWWYLPNLVPLYQRFRLTTAGADWEQDPSVWSWLGWVYYPRCLSAYYLFLPLTLLLLASLWQLARNPEFRRSLSGQLLCATVLGGWVLLSLLKAKDPRYIMPLVGPVAILLVWGWIRSSRVVVAVTALTAVQFVLVSFRVPLVPQKIALFEIPGDQDYASMRQEWVFFATHYFGVAGPPRSEDWRYREILQRLRPGERIGFIPDAAFFHPGALELMAAHQGMTLQVARLGMDDDWPRTLEHVDRVIGKTGNQGISYITLYNREVYGALETLNWPRLATWELPDGSQAILWQNPSRSP